MFGPLRVEPARGPCRVDLVAPFADAHWSYRVPETLSCEEGIFKVYYHPTVDWQGPEPDGTIWHQWQTSDADLEKLTSHPQAHMYNPHFIQGIGYAVTLTPVPGGLDLVIRATNIHDRGVFHNVTAFPCLGHPSENFQDPDLQRTYIVTSSGLTCVGDLDRGNVDPRRTHFRVARQPAMPFVNTPFWGEARPTLAKRGVILRTRNDSACTIAATWERVSELFYNEDGHHCMHAVALLGDIAPGQTATVHGKIVLVAGGPEDALSALDQPPDFADG